MKKLLAMILVIAMIMGICLLTGCGDAKSDETIAAQTFDTT